MYADGIIMLISFYCYSNARLAGCTMHVMAMVLKMIFYLFLLKRSSLYLSLILYKFYLPTVCIGSDALKYVSDTKYLEFSSCDSKSDDNSTKFALNKVFVG